MFEHEDIIPGTELEDNTNQRTPCVLLLDCSGSMANNGNISRLNEGILQFGKDLKGDILARRRVQVAIVRFSGAEATTVSDWVDAADFKAPELSADGMTPMGMAVDLGLKMIEERKTLYKQYAIPYTRPWLFLLSDGEPTDIGWEESAKRCNEAEMEKKVLVWPIGVQGANMKTLAAFKAPDAEGSRHIHSLEAVKFVELFQWLSASLSRTSQGVVGSRVEILIPPTTMLVET
ncbi:VWFA domain-containing protein [Gammaproteobacteria bacterium]